MPTRVVVRKRLCAARALAAGETVTAADLTGLRAESGLPISQWSTVIGQRLARPVEHLAALVAADLVADQTK